MKSSIIITPAIIHTFVRTHIQKQNLVFRIVRQFVNDTLSHLACTHRIQPKRQSNNHRKCININAYTIG